MPQRLRVALLVAATFLPTAIRAGETVSRPGVLHLSLDDAIRMALAKNFSIEVTRFAPKIARERVTSAIGRFDPNFNVRWDSSEDTRRDFFLGARHVSNTSILQGDSASTGITSFFIVPTLYPKQPRSAARC